MAVSQGDFAKKKNENIVDAKGVDDAQILK